MSASPATGRCGFLKGLAGVASLPLLGNFVVKDAEAVDRAALAVPDTALALPPEAKLVVARELPRKVGTVEAYLRTLDVSFSYGGPMDVTGEVIFNVREDDAFERVLTQMRPGARLRMYVEVVDGA